MSRPHRLPSYPTAHIVAFCCVVLVHGALGWWQMRPQPPVVLPQQQVIQVALLSAPSQPQPQQTEVVLQSRPPQAEKGMFKTQPRPVTRPRPPEKISELPPEPPQKATQDASPLPAVSTPLTTGRQSQHATAQHAAETAPMAADYLQNPPPAYPRSALRKGQEGTVMVEVRVGVDGQAKQVRLRRSCGVSALDEAALTAVKKWRFIPARRGREAIEAHVVIPVEFRIN